MAIHHLRGTARPYLTITTTALYPYSYPLADVILYFVRSQLETNRTAYAVHSSTTISSISSSSAKKRDRRTDHTKERKKSRTGV